MNEENKIKLLIEISVLSNKTAMCYQLRMAEEGKKAEDECFGLVYQLHESQSGKTAIDDYVDFSECF